LGAFAETRAKATRQLTGIRISREETTTIGGFPAHELVAEGTNTSTGRLVTLYQIVLAEDGGYDTCSCRDCEQAYRIYESMPKLASPTRGGRQPA